MQKYFLNTNFSDADNRTQFRCLGLSKDAESLDSYLFADVCFIDRVAVSDMTLKAELRGNMSIGSRVIMERTHVNGRKGTNTG
jgi:hypothetical protein